MLIISMQYNFNAPSAILRRKLVGHSGELVLLTTAQWELKAAHPAGQLSVDLGVGVESVIHTTPLLLVQHDLQHLASIFLGPQSLSHNLDGVDDIGQDGLVDGGQSPASWALLSLGRARPVGALWSREDAARSENEHVAVRELLLQFTRQPLLDLVEAGEKRDGDEDDNGALAVANFELLSS